MATPARGVVARALAPNGCPVKDLLDAATHAGGGLGGRVPYRLKHCQHLRQRRIAHGKRPDHGVSVLCQRVGPLLGVLRAFPAGCVRLYERFGALLERLVCSRSGKCGTACGAFLCQRVNATA